MNANVSSRKKSIGALPGFEKPDDRRAANMRAIQAKGMLPELAVRSLVHGLGYRFRLHQKNLPGKPDLVFAVTQRVIFVHGCFWHAHGCSRAHVPRSNKGYWVPKLTRNRQRDRKNLKALVSAGWSVLVIWECEVPDRLALRRKVLEFLDGGG